MSEGIFIQPLPELLDFFSLLDLSPAAAWVPPSVPESLEVAASVAVSLSEGRTGGRPQASRRSCSLAGMLMKLRKSLLYFSSSLRTSPPLAARLGPGLGFSSGRLLTSGGKAK